MLVVVAAVLVAEDPNEVVPDFVVAHHAAVLFMLSLSLSLSDPSSLLELMLRLNGFVVASGRAAAGRSRRSGDGACTGPSCP